MSSNQVYVSVVGFSDVERHALNTIFRLSEEHEPTYVPWQSGGAGRRTGMTVPDAEVALVDGECAEAVVHRAREAHESQRLIWVGANPPEHAWRVLERPIHWASLLSDLDMVYAAKQADSGHIDLDISSPSPLADDSLGLRPSRFRRALIVGANADERLYLKGRLALAAVIEIDEAQTNEQAMERMKRYEYVCAVFNMDDSQLDAWMLAHTFRQRNPQAITLGMSAHAGPLGDWWSRRRMEKSSRRTGVHALVAKPPRPWELARWLEDL
ncbi:hypothetical protein [Hydrogenophaga sp. 5NK40-0174]|uniref:hypothetical protein n=1 Tax=Hydrogenophaga sp. 5NK40-0174 TaxID=3127649 RepID=UPI00310216EE